LALFTSPFSPRSVPALIASIIFVEINRVFKGIRSGISPEIRTIQVYAPPTKQFAAIEEQFNFADPFGKERGSMNTGMVTLAPGKSVEWHVRLALFQPNK
jgi:hypothetical protein